MTRERGTQTDDLDEPTATTSIKRRTLLASSAGLTVGAAGLGAFAGTVAAWDREDVDFKGCSEVWMIVGDRDLNYDPPVVAHVIVGTADGGTDCRLVEFTEENATTIPGQYGDAPIVKYTAGDDEKVLAVIHYNYIKGAEGDDRLAKPSCLLVNDHRCAQTPNTPDLYEADCVEDAYNGHWEGSYWDDDDCLDRIVGGSGPPGRGDGNNGPPDRSDNGNGPPSGSPGRGPD